MASAGKSAGRVSVRVVPDSTGFREELRGQLNKLERDLKVNVKAQLDRSDFDRQFRDLQSDANGKKIQLQASLNSKLATAEIAKVARNRFVDLSVRLNKASLAKAGTALAALSGGRGVGEGLQRLGTYLGNLDRHLPKLALTGLAIANIGAAALSSVGGLVTLGAGLAQVAGAALVLPAILGGAIVGVGVLSLAMKDAGTQLKSLTPALSRFQKAISGSFWDAAAKPIKKMVNTLLPRLKSGTTDVADALGQLTGKFAKELTTSLTSNNIDGFMTNLAKGIDNAKSAIQPLVSAFTTLGQVGARYFPAMGTAISNVATQFNTFVKTAAGNGSLTRWIDNGIASLKLLGSVVGSVGSILSGLFKAADASGGNGLVSFATNLQKIADVVNQPAFQGALTTLFAGAQDAMRGLGAAIGPIGEMFVSLAPTIAGVLGTAGQAVGSFLASIASALSQPAFARGLTAFFNGIATGLAAIAPALPAVATALGALGGVAGALAGALGGVLGAALSALAPLVTVLATALQPLIPVLGSALVGAINAVAPALLTLVTALSSGLGPIVTALVPIISLLATTFASIVTALVPIIPPILALVAALLTGLLPVVVQLAPVLTQLATTFGTALLTAITAIAPMLPALIDAFMQLVTAVVPLLPQIVGLALAFLPLIPSIIALVVPLVQLVAAFLQMTQASGTLGQAISIVGTAISFFAQTAAATFGLVSAAISVLVAAFSGKFSSIPGIVSGAMTGFLNAINTATKGAQQRFITFATNAITSIKTFGTNLVTTVSTAVTKFVTSISTGVGKAVTAIKDLPGKAKSALSNIGTTLKSAGADLVNGFIDGMKSAIGRVATAAADMAKRAVDAAKSALGIKSPSRVFYREVGVPIGQGLANGVLSQKGNVNSTIASLVSVPKVASASAARIASYESGGTQVQKSYTFGNSYGHTAQEIAAEFFRLLGQQEALNPDMSW